MSIYPSFFFFYIIIMLLFTIPINLTKQTDLVYQTCPIGYECHDGHHEQSTKCPIGYYCSNGIKNKCHRYKLCDTEGLSKSKDCPKCFFCESGMKYECPIGKYCKNGIKRDCPKGKLCDEVKLSTYKECPKRKLCEDGKEKKCPNWNCDFCEDGKKKKCPSGNFCKDGKAKICNRGNFCRGGKEYSCPLGKLCNDTGLSVPYECPKGFMCYNGKKYECPVSYYCEGGVWKDCPITKLCNESGLSKAKECPKGYFCEDGEAKICSRGKFCNNGRELPCLFGKLCDEERLTIPNECPKSFWCREDKKYKCSCVKKVENEFYFDDICIDELFIDNLEEENFINCNVPKPMSFKRRVVIWITFVVACIVIAVFLIFKYYSEANLTLFLIFLFLILNIVANVCCIWEYQIFVWFLHCLILIYGIGWNFVIIFKMFTMKTRISAITAFFNAIPLINILFTLFFDIKLLWLVYGFLMVNELIWLCLRYLYICGNLKFLLLYFFERLVSEENLSDRYKKWKEREHKYIINNIHLVIIFFLLLKEGRQLSFFLGCYLIVSKISELINLECELNKKEEEWKKKLEKKLRYFIQYHEYVIISLLFLSEFLYFLTKKKYERVVVLAVILLKVNFSLQYQLLGKTTEKIKDLTIDVQPIEMNGMLDAERCFKEGKYENAQKYYKLKFKNLKEEDPDDPYVGYNLLLCYAKLYEKEKNHENFYKSNILGFLIFRHQIRNNEKKLFSKINCLNGMILYLSGRYHDATLSFQNCELYNEKCDKHSEFLLNSKKAQHFEENNGKKFFKINNEKIVFQSKVQADLARVDVKRFCEYWNCKEEFEVNSQTLDKLLVTISEKDKKELLDILSKYCKFDDGSELIKIRSAMQPTGLDPVILRKLQLKILNHLKIKNILLVGEADFSYTCQEFVHNEDEDLMECQLSENGIGVNIFASEFYSEEELGDKYKNFQNNLLKLKNNRCRFRFGIDATKLHENEFVKNFKWDRIQFNGPRSKGTSYCYDAKEDIKTGKYIASNLCKMFFNSCTEIQREGDQVHIILPFILEYIKDHIQKGLSDKNYFLKRINCWYQLANVSTNANYIYKGYKRVSYKHVLTLKDKSRFDCFYLFVFEKANDEMGLEQIRKESCILDENGNVLTVKFKAHTDTGKKKDEITELCCLKEEKKLNLDFFQNTITMNENYNITNILELEGIREISRVYLNNQRIYHNWLDLLVTHQINIIPLFLKHDQKHKCLFFIKYNSYGNVKDDEVFVDKLKKDCAKSKELFKSAECTFTTSNRNFDDIKKIYMDQLTDEFFGISLLFFVKATDYINIVSIKDILEPREYSTHFFSSEKYYTTGKNKPIIFVASGKKKTHENLNDDNIIKICKQLGKQIYDKKK